MRSAVAVMSKLPIPGFTKTRLIGRLTPEDCAALHMACLKDLIEALLEISTVRHPDQIDFTCQGFLYLAETGVDSRTKEALLKGLHLERCHHLLGLADEELQSLIMKKQHGEGLGARMAGIIEEILQCHDRALIIGADIPGVTAAELKDALSALQEYDVVLGPTHDGGYYLVGMKQPHRGVFSDEIRWSTPEVLEKTLALCHEHGLTVKLMPKKWDLDVWSDAEAFYKEAKNQSKPCRATGLLGQWIEST